MTGLSLLDLVVAMVGGLVPDRHLRSAAAQRASELRTRGRADLAIRLVAGHVSGLGPEFRSGAWNVRSGEVSLGTARVAVDCVGSEVRPTTFRETFQVFHDSRVYAALSGDATVELAIQERDAAWVLAILSGPLR